MACNIQDFPDNVTRFLVIGQDFNPPSREDKTSILCSLKDRPGALYEMIEPFYRHGINMTKIESRPTKKQLWEYNFFIDFAGHYQEKEVADLLDELRSKTLNLKILGSYPKGLTY
jgi:chorismate mutase/prephenate dehydratase